MVSIKELYYDARPTKSQDILCCTFCVVLVVMTAKYTSVNVCCDASRSVKGMLFALHKVLELHIIHEADFERASGTSNGWHLCYFYQNSVNEQTVYSPRGVSVSILPGNM